MKKFKKVLYVIISVVIFAGAIAAALDFMGVINLKKRIKQAQTEGVSQDVVKIASDIMAFEEDNINKMKNYL